MVVTFRQVASADGAAAPGRDAVSAAMASVNADARSRNRKTCDLGIDKVSWFAHGRIVDVRALLTRYRQSDRMFQCLMTFAVQPGPEGLTISGAAGVDLAPLVWVAVVVGVAVRAPLQGCNSERNAGVSVRMSDTNSRVHPVADALSIQSRVINALILREAHTRYGQHKIGFLWALVEPALMVAVFVLVLVFMRSSTVSGMPQVPFIICGIVPFFLFRNTMSQMQGSIATNRSLLGFPQVTTFDVLIARGLLEVAVMLCVFVFLLSVSHLTGYAINIERPLDVLSACLAMALIGLGGGFLFASLLPLIPSMRQITTMALGRPLFLTSGLFFTADSLPHAARDLMLYNPLLHVLELLRSAFFVEFESEHGSWGYVLSWAIGLLAAGLTTHQALRRRATIGL